MMQKIVVGLIVTVLLIGCSSAGANEKERFTVQDKNIVITTDTETGCKYIIFSSFEHGGGITPLLKPDGYPDCGK